LRIADRLDGVERALRQRQVRKSEVDRRGTAGNRGIRFEAEARPLPTEPVVEKNAFIGADLADRLRAGKSRSVVIAGLTTDHCCSTTARPASDLGFHTAIVGDATATFDRQGRPASGSRPSWSTGRRSPASTTSSRRS
jgi:nicotinamidase-related amidase